MINHLSQLLLIFFLQSQIFPIQPPIDWPDLESPTPYQTPTIDPTAAAAATVVLPQQEMLNELATVEGQVQALPTTIAAANGQIYYQGMPILPDEGGGQLWSYFKWASSTSGAAIFGPFQPVLIHLSVLILLALIGLLVFFLQIIISLIIKFVMWIFGLIKSFF